MAVKFLATQGRSVSVARSIVADPSTNEVSLVVETGFNAFEIMQALRRIRADIAAAYRLTGQAGLSSAAFADGAYFADGSSFADRNPLGL